MQSSQQAESTNLGYIAYKRREPSAIKQPDQDVIEPIIQQKILPLYFFQVETTTVGMHRNMLTHYAFQRFR